MLTHVPILNFYSLKDPEARISDIDTHINFKSSFCNAGMKELII